MFSEIATAAARDDKLIAFVMSDVFDRMFRDGMDLVEETAAYLDGEGRTEAKRLERAAALSYASESMRLTTRLMQAASWLLVQRAVREGEMSARDALDPKYRLGARGICAASGDRDPDLPLRLVALLDRSALLYDRIDRLDAQMLGDAPAPDTNPVNEQLARLQAALAVSPFRN